MYDETLALVLGGDRRKPASSLPARLDVLFRRLIVEVDDPAGFAVEDEIWEIWIGHADPELAGMLNEAIAAIASSDYPRAESVLAALIVRAPDYAEAWNKRATLAFLRRRDDDSVAAIARTLELEPRHFGAITGFAQICLRNGDAASARFAFDVALRINPRLAAVRIAVEELKRSQPITIH